MSVRRRDQIQEFEPEPHRPSSIWNRPLDAPRARQLSAIIAGSCLIVLGVALPFMLTVEHLSDSRKAMHRLAEWKPADAEVRHLEQRRGVRTGRRGRQTEYTNYHALLVYPTGDGLFSLIERSFGDTPPSSSHVPVYFNPLNRHEAVTESDLLRDKSWGQEAVAYAGLGVLFAVAGYLVANSGYRQIQGGKPDRHS